MKHSRKFVVILLLALLLIAAITVAACTPDDSHNNDDPNGGQGGNEPTPHQHTFSSMWSSNDSEHWHVATCGHDVTADRAAHNFGTDNVCDTCGYTKAQGGNQGGSDNPDGGQGR